MALPKFDKETFKAAALSAALVLSPASSLADGPSTYASPTKTSFSNVNLPSAQTPTAQRPYHYMRFDADTKAQYPGSEPITAMTNNGEKLVVLNFIDEKNPKYSQMQTQVLSQTLAALAPRSEAKELLLMDVVVRDRQGRDVNWSYFSTFYDENELGPNKTKRQDAVLPYGIAYGEPLAQNGDTTLFDFSLTNGAQTDADLRENAKAIYGRLYVTIEGYNQKQVAALNKPDQVLVATND